MTAARQQRPLSERELQTAVIDTARRLGWRVMGVGKVQDRRGYWRTNWLADGKGWPDLTLVRGPWMLCVELKVGVNRPEPDQKLWRDALARVPGVVTAVWFDTDWHSGKVEAVLADPESAA